MHQTLTPLRPFRFHSDLKEFLSKREKLWSWFSEDKAKKQYFERFKQNLLKDSYRLDTTSHPELYKMIDEIKEKINLPLTVTIYQEQMAYQNNVGISFYEGEAHIVISGRVLKLLDAAEMKAILAHELYHYYLFEIDKKGYEIADRIITSIANDNRSSDIYLETARLFKLYTELYCDRGAYMVMEDINPCISALVKLTTGLDKVNAESYLIQADEILNNEKKASEGNTHPESFIRAKALQLWSEKQEEADEEIEKFIESKIEYEKLNIFSQKELDIITKKMIGVILRPSWNKTDRITNLANEYFPKSAIPDIENTEEFFDEVNALGDSTKKYLAYTLLDFSLVDPDQGNVSLGYAFELAENAGLKDEFKLVVKKEIKLTERKFTDLQKEASEALNQVNESKEDSLYGE